MIKTVKVPKVKAVPKVKEEEEKEKTLKEPKEKTVKEPKVKEPKEKTVKEKTVKVKEPKVKEPKEKTVKEPKEPKVKEPKVKEPKEPKVKELKELKEPKEKTIEITKDEIKETLENYYNNFLIEFKNEFNTDKLFSTVNDTDKTMDLDFTDEYKIRIDEFIKKWAFLARFDFDVDLSTFEKNNIDNASKRIVYFGLFKVIADKIYRAKMISALTKTQVKTQVKTQENLVEYNSDDDRCGYVDEDGNNVDPKLISADDSAYD